MRTKSSKTNIWKTEQKIYQRSGVAMWNFRNKCEIFYKTNPLVVTKAYMQYLYDENSNCFIDCNSNVQHGKLYLYGNPLVVFTNLNLKSNSFISKNRRFQSVIVIQQ